MLTMWPGGTLSPICQAKTTSSPSLPNKCPQAPQATIRLQRKRTPWSGSLQARNHNRGAQSQEAGEQAGHLRSLESSQGETFLCQASLSRGMLAQASLLSRTIQSLGCRTCQAQDQILEQKKVELQVQMTVHLWLACTPTAKDQTLSSSACLREM